MFLSYRWLARHVDLDGLTPEDVVSDLTLSTAEVEGLERFAPHLADVTVGFVATRESHPDADKLSVCTVDVGGSEKLQIVCGAPNVAAGQKVAVAQVGTSLPGDSGGDFKIKKAKIRGVESRGMICSVRELDLGDEHDGIWVLPEDATVGHSVADALGLDDWVIEIDNKSVTHRPDLWGHRGFAREIAAIRRRPMKPIATELPPTGNDQPYPVRIESPDCSRYLAIPIDGVTGGPSPAWMRHLLLAVGQRPLDLLVDISNFVMLDLGQPNHLFDRDRLSPEGIVVRKARPGETMQTLDGFERKLTTADLLICSGDVPVALAGVMGGEGSKVETDTSRLLLEVATFDPVSVRRTSARLGLRTDSSARFEKHLDPTLPMKAAAHMVALLRQMVPDLTLPSPVTDVGEWSDPARTIELRGDRVRRLLGVPIEDADIEDILVRLGFGVTRDASGPIHVAVPSERATRDITMEQDLVEEVGRIFRYGNVPEQELVVELGPPHHDERRELVRKLQDRLAGGARMRETISYSFLTDDFARRLGVEGLAYTPVINPVAEGLSRVRRSVLPSLLAVLESNRRHAEEVRLFEVGKGYRPEEADERGQPREHHLVALAFCEKPRKAGRFDEELIRRVQGVVDDLSPTVSRVRPRWRKPAGELPAWANPGRALEATLDAADGGELVLGVLAELDPELAPRLGLDGELESDVVLAELSVDAWLAAREDKGSYRPIPRFPGVKVDVAVALDQAVPAADVRAAIEKAGKGLVSDMELFDVYTGPNLAAGRRSLAYHVALQSDSRTLNDKDIHKFLDRVEGAVKALGGELRRE